MPISVENVCTALSGTAWPRDVDLHFSILVKRVGKLEHTFLAVAICFIATKYALIRFLTPTSDHNLLKELSTTSRGTSVESHSDRFCLDETTEECPRHKFHTQAIVKVLAAFMLWTEVRNIRYTGHRIFTPGFCIILRVGTPPLVNLCICRNKTLSRA